MACGKKKTLLTRNRKLLLTIGIFYVMRQLIITLNNVKIVELKR